MKRKFINFVRRIVGFSILLKELKTIRNGESFRWMAENCEWLKHKQFTPGWWAMDNAALYTLLSILNYMKPKKILEFGLGQSSLLIYQYVASFENTKALTVEHDRQWTDFFCNGTPVNIDVQQHDTEIVEFNGFKTLSYKDMGGLLEEKYDLIVVDGPFGSNRYSRSQAIRFAEKSLKERFCIFMDDSNRQGERDTLDEICKILMNKNIKYCTGYYVGEKNSHTIICSEDLKFLTSLSRYD